jgi:hypothetical protein
LTNSPKIVLVVFGKLLTFRQDYQPMEAPYVTIGQIASVGFFFYSAIMPIIGK